MANLSSRVTPTGVATAAQGSLADSALQPTGDGSGLTGVNAFKPVEVTGTTPSLNVGDYNFFDNGTLTANTTVSFASVPTEAKWSYSCVVEAVNSWDVSAASYSQSFSVAATGDSAPAGLFFKPDGTSMYYVGDANDGVYQYSLSTAWDVSTASLAGLKAVGNDDSTPYGLSFKPDGTKMYVLGNNGDSVYEYDLSTAWSIASAVYLQSFSVATQESEAYSLFFKPDGTKMYIVGVAGDSVYEYALSTAWDVSAASYSQSFSVATQDANPRGVSFKSDGLKMYVVGAVGDSVYEYSLSTAWDVSTAVYSQSFSVATQESEPTSVTFKPDGTKMYVAGTAGVAVNEYNIGTGLPASITFPASVENPPTVALAAGDTVTYDFYTTDSGTTVTLLNKDLIAANLKGPLPAIDGSALTGVGSSTYGDVGTYIFGRRAGSTADQVQFVAGTTYAGSTLYPAGISSNSADTALRYNTSSGSLYSGDYTSAAVSGTWRAMGTTRAGNTFRENPVTLFVRIS